jgi:hypothetical protein
VDPGEFRNIIELMAAVEKAAPDVREQEIAAALRQSAKTDYHPRLWRDHLPAASW